MPVAGEPTEFYTEQPRGGKTRLDGIPNSDKKNKAQIHLHVKNPRADFYLPLGNGIVHLTEGGVGGFSKTARPEKKSMTDWEGVAAYSMEAVVLFDGWSEGRSVERECHRLLRLGEPRGGNRPPPVVAAYGPMLPLNGRHWVIQGFAWATEEPDVLLDEDGRRLRQAVTITFDEYVRPDDIELQRVFGINDPIVGTAHGNLGGDTGIKGPLLDWYTVKKGDTLYSIAMHYYKDRGEWKYIARANGNIRDPRAIKPGQKLKIPEM